MMLSKDGYALRNAIASAGFEITPDELELGLTEAHQRISGGKCKRCGQGDYNTELRFGVCFKCMMKEPDPNDRGFMKTKPDWWPENPYPETIFPMKQEQYSEIVPDPDIRTALSGMLGREFWEIASETIFEAMTNALEMFLEGIEDFEK